MKQAANILNKVMVRQFYTSNAGFFLFFLFFFFGIVQAGHIVSYHLSLMQAMITSPLFLFVVMTGWLLYNIKCTLFCTDKLQQDDGQFLFTLSALPFLKQVTVFTAVSTALYLPVLLYSCFLVAVALAQKAVTFSVVVILCQLLMIAFGSTVIYRSINKRSESRLAGLVATCRKKLQLKLGYHAFIMAYVFTDRKLVFAVVKLFSLLLLSMFFIRNGDSFDADLFSIFYPFCIIAHARLVFTCVEFNETLLHYNRNLPLHWLKVALTFLVTWIFILLPETLFMLINNQGNLPAGILLSQPLTAMAMLMLFTGIAYASALDMERYLLFIFVSYIVLLILQKAIGYPATLVCCAAMAMMIFKAHYYSFEKEK